MDSGVQSNYDAQFGKYTLVAKLATGGMGEIFLAKLTGMAGFEKLVVIKRLLPHLAEDEHFVMMLLDEARVAARLSHPNVCQVYDLGEVGGVFYIAMEFLEGVPCSQLLKNARQNEQQLGVDLAANILQQTCAGLHHAHSLKDHKGQHIGLVHRDVSPSNLFATVSGAIKVLDFGVAKSQDARARTHTGALKGKYAYMSPEQVMAHDLDRRSDVFSLGIVLFELLTTRRLFWRDSEYKMFQAIAEEPIPDVREFRPDTPGPLADVVIRALSRDVSKRYPTAEAMGEAIANSMSSYGGVASNSKISAYVRENFNDQIRERRELVVTAVSPHNQPTVSDGRADMGEHSRELALDAPEILVERSPDVLEDLLGDLAAEQKTSDRGRSAFFYIALAGVGVVAALGASFLLGFLDGNEKEGTIVIEGQTVVRDAAPAPSVDLDASTETSDTPEASKPVKEKAPERRDPVITVKADPEYFARTFSAKQSRAVKRCLARHPNDALDGTKLEMLVEEDGTVSKATMRPSSARRSGFGRCLQRVARGMKFGRIDERSTVVLPIDVKKLKMKLAP